MPQARGMWREVTLNLRGLVLISDQLKGISLYEKFPSLGLYMTQ